MKTAEEFYNEIRGSKELQEELNSLKEKTLEDFLKKHDCEGTAKEFADFARSQEEGEIEDSEVEAASGGDIGYARWALHSLSQW